MENRKGTPLYFSKPPTPRIFIFHFLFSTFFFTGGCGAPGEPVPPSPPVPVAIADLSAHQSGDGVELLFTLPSKSVSGQKLTATPSVEILRGTLQPDGKADAKSFRVVDTIPGSMMENYRVAGHIRFTDPIAPEETKTHPGGNVAYLVRTRTSPKRASPDSNIVTTRVFPVAERITGLQLHLTESAVELAWPAATHTSAGDALPSAPAYRIYRGEIAAGTPPPAGKDLPLTKWSSPLALLTSISSNSYRDTQFDFGKTYVYLIRTVLTYEGSEVESDASEPASLTPIDIFPPAAPQGLVAAVLPGATPGSFVVDLSWSINIETDLAGYRVYRSEQEGTGGQLITPDLLPTPAVRDNSVQPGHRYWYTVTAVDRAGNESPPSTPVAADLTQPSS